MNLIKYNTVFLILFAILCSCKENSVNTPLQTESLVFQLDGIIENIGGDCSAVQVRTRSLGNFDLTNVPKIKFKLSGMSDADLSSISFFYYNGGQIVNIINLSDREQINNTSSIEANSPGINTELFSRVTLQSSVCTGQIFHLTLRDLKIYTIK